MTRQELEAKIKHASDRMRADDNTKLVTKYIEHLAWLLFLKAHEAIEDENELLDSAYRRVIIGEFRWSVWTGEDWASDELLSFVTGQLFPYLRSLTGSRPREFVATIFNGVTTVMKSGYGLKEVIGIVDGIDFHSPEDVHTLSVIYESLLARLGNEANWSGEFYTPRPIVALMVRAVNPMLGQTVYDPAAGSAGFLVEAYRHMRLQERTLEDHRRLQEQTFIGQENGELPFLLGAMNMILHGIHSPDLTRRNTLETDVRAIRPEERRDVVLTNPPFGGKENPQIQQNFPIRTSATEVLFLQHVLASLKPEGRCGIVVPDGVLFDDDAAFRAIRKVLISECNLHTIVRLPPGSFQYTAHQRLNLLFFDRVGPTKGIWFYEHPVPESRRHLKHPRYTKTQPLQFEEFGPLLGWWENRQSNDWGWYVPVSQLNAGTVDLDLRHPDRPVFVEVTSPDALSLELNDAVESITAYSGELLRSVALVKIGETVDRTFAALADAGVVFNPESRDPGTEPDTLFTYIDLSSVDRGVIIRGAPIRGSEAPSRARRVVRKGDVLFAAVRPYLRGHAVVTGEFDGAIASTGFVVLRPPDSIEPNYLLLALMSPSIVRQTLEMMKGAHYPALKLSDVKRLSIPLPKIAEQRKIVEVLWPQLLGLRTARISLTQQIQDVEDLLKDSEFVLLSGPTFDRQANES